MTADTIAKLTQVKAMKAETEINKIEKDIKESQRTEAKRREKFIKKHPKQASYTRGISEWTGAFGNLFNGSFRLGK